MDNNIRQLGLAAHNFANLLRPAHEYPWQVRRNASRDGGHGDWINLDSVGRSRDDGHGGWINLHAVSHSRDDGHGGWLDILSPLPPSSGADFLRWQRGGSRNGNTLEGRAADLVEWEERFGGELELNYQEIKVVFNRDGD